MACKTISTNSLCHRYEMSVIWPIVNKDIVVCQGLPFSENKKFVNYSTIGINPWEINMIWKSNLYKMFLESKQVKIWIFARMEILNTNTTDRSGVRKSVRRSGFSQSGAPCRADRPAVQIGPPCGPNPPYRVGSQARTGLASYVYPCAYKAKKSVFRSGI